MLSSTVKHIKLRLTHDEGVTAELVLLLYQQKLATNKNQLEHPQQNWTAITDHTTAAPGQQSPST
jgi:hypothetical protein